MGLNNISKQIKHKKPSMLVESCPHFSLERSTSKQWSLCTYIFIKVWCKRGKYSQWLPLTIPIWTLNSISNRNILFFKRCTIVRNLTMGRHKPPLCLSNKRTMNSWQWNLTKAILTYVLDPKNLQYPNWYWQNFKKQVEQQPHTAAVLQVNPLLLPVHKHIFSQIEMVRRGGGGGGGVKLRQPGLPQTKREILNPHSSDQASVRAGREYSSSVRSKDYLTPSTSSIRPSLHSCKNYPASSRSAGHLITLAMGTQPKGAKAAYASLSAPTCAASTLSLLLP